MFATFTSPAQRLMIDALASELALMNTRLMARQRIVIEEATKLLAENLKEEFKRHDGGSLKHYAPTSDEVDATLSKGPGGWTSFGSPYSATKVRTMQTMHVSYGGLEGRITIGGGAPYVEYGTAPHVIPGAPVLHWHTDSGDEAWAREVYHPGYAGDPFVERAIDRTREMIQSNLAFSIAGQTFGRLALRRYGLALASERVATEKFFGTSGPNAILAGQQEFDNYMSSV